MEAAAVVSASHGAMGSLLGKLGELLTIKYKLLKEAKGQIMFLKAELDFMHAFMKEISDKENPSEQDKCWAKDVRELSYDIEDSIDEFMLRVECDSSKKPRGFKGFVTRSMKLLTTMNTRHEIAKEFEGLKIRVKEASERRRRYEIVDAVPKENNTSIDPRLSALHAETTSLVGVTGPRDQLIQLMDGEGVPAHQLKVLSIVGFGGLGKTTLANEIYRKLEGKFQCQAFVSVSQKPNMTKILRTILFEVGFVAPKDSGMEVWKESELINSLNKHLLDKRYFIVIDDIWDASAWDIIKCALPKNVSGSRVIATTRHEDVARACCSNSIEYLYKMKTLSDRDSRSLFFRRIFGSEDACPPYLNEVSAEILNKCGGLPLAIITISSLLANQPNKLKMEQWEYVRNSIGSNFEMSPSLKVMRQILNLSYINLPHHLRTCMLYLGIYPEDYTIDKNDLTSQWVAEGFICKSLGTDPEVIAMGYFNELINRNIIQPIYTDYDGEVMACRVHDMMLDLILHKSREENFITVIDDIQDMTGHQENIRRISLNLDGEINGTAAICVQQSQIRTLARFGTSSSSQLHSLKPFKHLRVIRIEISGRYHPASLLDLGGIGHLFELRSLKIIAWDHRVVLPSKIGDLQQLETFEIQAGLCSSKGLQIQKLPSDIFNLSRLLHLRIPRYVIFPDGIGNMKSLLTLFSFNISKNSADNIKGLGELTNLRHLEIRCDNEDFSVTDDKVVERAREVLLTSLYKLCNLKYLYMQICPQDAYMEVFPMPSSFCRLQRFDAYSNFLSVPEWIGNLHSLINLVLYVKEVVDDFGMLAQLPSLMYLTLNIREAPKDKITIHGSGFPLLNYFRLRCSRISWLAFEVGAMPRLERLNLFFNAHKWDRYGGTAPAGIEHLSGLKEINVDIGGLGAKESNRKAAESALRDAADMHPRRLVANIFADEDRRLALDHTDDEPEEEDGSGGSSTTT